MNENLKSMFLTIAGFDILPHFTSLLSAMSSTWGHQKRVLLIFVSLNRKYFTKMLHKTCFSWLIFWRLIVESLNDWTNKQRWIALINRFEDCSLIWAVFQLSRTNDFTFSVIHQFSMVPLDKGTTPSSLFPKPSVPKRTIQQYIF